LKAKNLNNTKVYSDRIKRRKKKQKEKPKIKIATALGVFQVSIIVENKVPHSQFPQIMSKTSSPS